MKYTYMTFKPEISLKQSFLIFDLLLKCFLSLTLATQIILFVFAVHNRLENHEALFCQPSLS